MITDKVCNAIKSYLADRAGTDLATATISTRDDDADLTYPSLVIAENGEPEQHEVLRCEWTVPVRVILRTIPEDTAEATHQTMTGDLSDLLGDIDGMVGFLSRTIPTHDAWGGQGMTDTEGDYRQTEFSLELRVMSG